MIKISKYLDKSVFESNYEEEDNSEPTWLNWLGYIKARNNIYSTYKEIQKLNEKRVKYEQEISEEENKDDSDKRKIYRLRDLVTQIKSRIENLSDNNLSAVIKLGNLHPKYEYLAKSYIERLRIDTNNKYTKLKLLSSSISKNKEDYKDNIEKIKEREYKSREDMNKFLEKEEKYKEKAESKKNEGK